MMRMGHRMPPPPMAKARTPQRKFNNKAEDYTYQFVREDTWWIFVEAVQEFIEQHPNYEIVENHPFDFPSNGWHIAVFKLKDSKIKSKTTIKE